MAVAVRQPDGTLTKPDDLVSEIKRKIGQAREDRKRFEGSWHLNLAFAAGKCDYVWDRFSRTLQLDPRIDDETELYHADVITEQRAAQLGELNTGDDQPELLGVTDNSEHAEQIQEQLNQAVGHGWNHEWASDDTIREMRRKLLDLGVIAIRTRFDPLAGPVRTDQDGNPITMPVGPNGVIRTIAEAREFVAQAQAAGEQVRFVEIHEGRTRWELGTPFNLLVPPGITHEKDFPWIVWVRPLPLDQVKAEYGAVADELTEDTDIGSLDGLIAAASNEHSQPGADPVAGRVRGHVWVFTYEELPCPKYPKGRTVVLGGNEMHLLDTVDELPYQGPDKTHRSSIVFFHWWRRSDAFWSRAFIENLKDPQRMIDRRKRQEVEIIDRSMPFHMVEKGSLPIKHEGRPMEWVEFEKGYQVPQTWQGFGPGAHFTEAINGHREDLMHASTLGPVMMGENPENAQTYGQLAVLNERENSKRADILQEHEAGIGRIVENCVHDIRAYWPEQKQILISGEDDRMQAALFSKSTIPDFYLVRRAKGSAKPRSQGAELRKVEDLWAAAIASGVAVRDPRWLSWYAESLKAGEALDIPEMPNDDQLDKAQLENHVLLQGAHVEVAYYDLPAVHIAEHRSAQIQAEISGNLEGYEALEQHVQQHLLVARQNAAEIAAEMPAGPLPEQPGA